MGERGSCYPPRPLRRLRGKWNGRVISRPHRRAAQCSCLAIASRSSLTLNLKQAFVKSCLNFRILNVSAKHGSTHSRSASDFGPVTLRLVPP